MTPNIPEQSEFANFMTLSWNSHPVSGVSHDGAIQKLNLSTQERPLPAGFKSVGQRITRLAADPARTKGLADARRWLSGHPAIEPGSLKQLRLEKGLSQQQLADQINSTQAHIAKLEKGTVDPKVSTVCRVAAALQVESEVVFVLLKNE